MNSFHQIVNCDSRYPHDFVSNNSVALVVTSPPYPLIEMWDECFSMQSPAIRFYLESKYYNHAFHAMHDILDTVWRDIDRVLVDGGIVCINIGDATRNCDGKFQVFPNHAKIIGAFSDMGYSVLPDIHWHKPVNTPNKFMGSGMYPPSAYVTYEHEYILIFRKGNKRKFKKSETELRRESSYFWEERNIWFSDLWDVKGTSQVLQVPTLRSRSGAFPFEVAYRLINMYSVKGDLIYDPFLGTGTTTRAAIASQRNSVGCEIEESLCQAIIQAMPTELDVINQYIASRLSRHMDFVNKQSEPVREKMYFNKIHGFPVKTRQETDLMIKKLQSVVAEDSSITVQYEPLKSLERLESGSTF